MTRSKEFQITVVRPEGYLHSECFREVAETLQFGLRSIGHKAKIQENVFDPSATNIILGGHLLAPQHAQMIPDGSILYNLEQIGGAKLPETFYLAASRHQVWDYSPLNIAKWKEANLAFQPVLVELGYVPELQRIVSAPLQDIDVMFYGSINERRLALLKKLQEEGLEVFAAFGGYGEQRDALIARSKVVLNVHYYNTQVFEIVRVSYLLANSKAVVTEVSPDIGDLTDAVASFSYDSLVEGCLELVRNEAKRTELEKAGFQRFSAKKETGILNAALNVSDRRPAVTAQVRPAFVGPSRMNMGSGKDWREDYLNVDFNAYWEPDAVLDFSKPLPIGEPLETVRFGTVVLENNSFDEIIANDVLEHIPNLVTAMTSCLSLLKVGGLFRIQVPYDLSWGAWQDPTHVRALNERSWLYYTEWFWYLGWTECRFEVAQLEYCLAPLGQQLQQNQVPIADIIRQPRAVDAMRVVLRKKPLTISEKQHVAGYLARPQRRQSVAIA